MTKAVSPKQNGFVFTVFLFVYRFEENVPEICAAPPVRNYLYFVCACAEPNFAQIDIDKSSPVIISVRAFGDKQVRGNFDSFTVDVNIVRIIEFHIPANQ